jgi:predicted small secreted protein
MKRRLVIVLAVLALVGAGCGHTSSGSGDYIPYEGNGGGPTQCADGTYSHSSGPGTCSWHGGESGS